MFLCIQYYFKKCHVSVDIWAVIFYNLIFLFLEEFIAHSGNVNCLALGHKSGAVLVTGGDDKKVNLWAVGKSSCIMVRNCLIFYIYSQCVKYFTSL